jgi:hypothetical protein
MSDVTDEPASFRDDLEPGIDDGERARLWIVADALIGGRLYPRAAFRAMLRERLPRRATLERPTAFWARVAALASPGTLLLVLVAAGVAHAGPFAP